MDDPGGADYQTRLVTDAKVCKLPDVMNTDIVGTNALQPAGMLMDMGDRLPEAADNYTSDVWKSVVRPGTRDHAALPWYTGLPVLISNKDLVGQAGVTEMPTSMSGYYDTVTKIGQAGNG